MNLPINLSSVNSPVNLSSMNSPFHLKPLRVMLPQFPVNRLEMPVPQNSADPLKSQINLLTDTFSCQFCCKFFFTVAEMREHEKSHVENKKLTCPICHMGFARRSYLSEHMCIHKGEQPHTCYYCGKLFSLRCNLVRHVRIHTGEKPFSCAICKQSFTLKKNMIEHERIHTGERPYQCPQCEFSFSRRSSLVRHARIHTGQKTYRCHDCNKTFSWKYYLRRHVSTHLRKRANPGKRRRTKEQIAIDAALQAAAGGSKIKTKKATNRLPKKTEASAKSDSEIPDMNGYRCARPNEPVSLPIDIKDIKVEESDEPCRPCTVLLPTADTALEDDDYYYHSYEEDSDVVKTEPPDEVPPKSTTENHKPCETICPQAFVVLPPLRPDSWQPRPNNDPLEKSTMTNGTAQESPAEHSRSPSVENGRPPLPNTVKANEGIQTLKFTMSRQEYDNFLAKKLVVELHPLPSDVGAMAYRFNGPTA